MVKELVERQIPLDICPTSNIRINIYPSIHEHPFSDLDKAGVIITINSDDPILFGNSLSDEYLTIANEFNYSIKDLVRFAKNSFEVSFAPSNAKEIYFQKILAWEKENLSDFRN